MQKLGTKACVVCGTAINGRLRSDRKAYYYPPRCERCHAFKNRKAEQHPAWKGGRSLRPDGYIKVHVGHQRYELEHRLVWERANGPIPEGHHIHHLNHDKTDNRLENLACLPVTLHTAVHGGPHNKTKGRWARGLDACVECGTNDAFHKGRGLCYRCYNRATYTPKERHTDRWKTARTLPTPVKEQVTPF